MQLDLFKVLQFYLYSDLTFVKQTEVQTAGNKKIYKKKDKLQLTPPILWLIQEKKIPIDNFKIVLKQLHQLTNEEVREVAELAFGKTIEKTADVQRSGIGKQYTIEVHIHENESVVINNQYEVAIAEKMALPGVRPVVTLIAPSNQPAVQAWFIQKEQDVFKLITQGKAFGKLR